MENGVAGLLGIEQGMVVQRRNWTPQAADRLHALLTAVERRCGGELLDESADEIVDVVLLCWERGGDDLTDALMDAMGNLGDDGRIWVLTSEAGQVEPDAPVGMDIGLDLGLGDGWRAVRLTWPPGRRTRR